MTTNNANLEPKKVSFTLAMNTTGFQNQLKRVLNDDRRRGCFVASLVSAVANNPALQECENGSILSAALLGESLKLSPSPQLGQYYLVPFKDNKTNTKNAVFVLGYKGMIQLAIRSGQYKFFNVGAVKEGELIDYNPITEHLAIEHISDFETREKSVTIGYFATFEYVNGFRKTLYWSYEKMLSHADKYSPAFSKTGYERLMNGEIPQKDLWKFSSFWYKDFDSMALKTMLRQLISHWGVMSVEMQNALEQEDAMNIEFPKSDFIEGEPLERLTQNEMPEQGEADEPQGDDAGQEQTVSLKDL